MFYLETADQLSLLVTLGFSFFIFSASLWFKRADVFSRLLGISFIIPFVLSVASFISHRKVESDLLFMLAELSLLIFMFLLLISRPTRMSYRFMAFIMILFPFALWYTLDSLPALQVALQEPSVLIIAYAVFAVANMFVLKKEHGSRDLLFWAVIPATALPLTKLFIAGELSGYVSFLLKLVNYFVIACYFHKTYYQALISSVTEAESKLSKYNRSLNLEVNKRVFEVEQVNRNLINKYKTDSLSAAFTKAAILEAIDELIVSKKNDKFSILMFDLDNFKTINDTLGHCEGDKCLKRLGLLTKSNIRDVDIFGRYGGDEFIIVLPGSGLNHALLAAERFRKKIETSEDPHLTISIGVACYPEDGNNVTELLRIADEGLYFSKSQGKNTVSHSKSIIKAKI